MAEDTIAQLKSKHEDALVAAEDQGWDEATEAASAQIHKLQDTIYMAGFDFCMDCADLPVDHELRSKTVLCPPDVFTAAQAAKQNAVANQQEEEDTGVRSPPQS